MLLEPQNVNINDYPSKPIGGGNPYYCCSFCGRSVPEIFGHLDRHNSYCHYRKAKEAILDGDVETMLTVRVELENYLESGTTYYGIAQHLVPELDILLGL